MRRSAFLAACLVAVLAVAMTGCQTKVVTAPGDGVALNTVTAQGEGKAAAAPDEAEMSFGVTQRDPDAEKALSAASKTADAIVSAIKKTGIKAEDIQTQNVALNPEYDYSGNKTPRVTGYVATVQVRVKMREIGKVGDVISAATGAGANEIYGPTFTLSDDSEAADEAIEKAVEDARRRAATIAKAAGKSVGEIISVSEGGVTSPPIYYEARTMAAADSAEYKTPIEPGQLDVSASVTVVFELK